MIFSLTMIVSITLIDSLTMIVSLTLIVNLIIRLDRDLSQCGSMDKVLSLYIKSRCVTIIFLHVRHGYKSTLLSVHVE